MKSRTTHLAQIGQGFFLAFLVAMTAQAQTAPDWSLLERHQECMTADVFSARLAGVYAPDGGMIPYLRCGDNQVSIFATADQTGAPLFVLRFSAPGSAVPPEAPRRLRGLHIALDPGHIGGAWSRMEERFFLVDRERDWPVQEAAMNLYVAHLLRERLEAAGATVTLVKDHFDPLSSAGPDALLAEARGDALPPPDSRFAHLPPLFIESSQRDAQRKQLERQFYRTAEIAARAERVNREIQPDLTLCIHFNATGYGDEKTLHEENGLAFFVHGNYLARELVRDDQKFFLLNKLLEQSHATEAGVARAIASAFAAATGLPPAYRVGPGGVMMPVGDDHYVYARNLAANRQFNGPVIFLEPYFMNNREVYARIQAGDYEGKKEIEGRLVPSIFREYADAVTAGLLAYYAD